MKYDILILGEPASGKSNFLRMMAFKWSLSNSVIRQQKTPTMNLNSDLLEGYLIDRTQEEYKNGTWLLEYKDNTVQITLPEYNGEEFTDLAKNTIWSDEWNQRIIDSEGIILMIPSDKDIVYDLANPPKAKVESKKGRRSKKNEEARYYNIAEQDLNYIRFFQHALAIKNLSRKKNKVFPLIIILNFWDKIQSDKGVITPEEQLEKILPWFAIFLKSNWDSNYLKIYGMSPLGDLAEDLFVRSKFPTNPTADQKKAREEFKKNLPKQSWVITNEHPSTKNYDANIPFEWMLKHLEK